MSKSDVAGRLDLVQSRDVLIPCLRLGNIQLVRNFLVGLHPVGGVDVYRGGDPLSLILGKFLEYIGDHRIPILLWSVKRLILESFNFHIGAKSKGKRIVQ